MKYVTLGLRLLIGGILFYAGFLKAVAPAAEFAAAIEAYHLLPAAWATPLSIALPWVEMWVGTFLIFGYYTPIAARAASMLFTIFMLALGSALLRHIDLASCGCFGAETFSPRQTIVIDVTLLLLSLALAGFAKKYEYASVDSLFKN